MNMRVRRGMAITAMGVALFATLGEASQEEGDDDDTEEVSNDDSNDDSNDSDGEAPTIGADQANPAPIGTTIEVAKDWDVTVDSVELDANATMAAVNTFNTPADGEQFVLVKVTISNKSDSPGTPLGNVDLALLPESGVAVDSLSCFGEVPDRFDSMAQMQPGATASGNLCFSVTPEEAQTAVLLAEPTFTLDELEDQRFFAIK